MERGNPGGKEAARMSEDKRMRDAATAAFRRWARFGCPDAEKIEMAGYKMPEELLACCAVFVVLEQRERRKYRSNTAAGEILRAVREVYMAEPGRPLRRQEVTMRVRRLATERWVSERMVYFWLSQARKLYWEFRRKA